MIEVNGSICYSPQPPSAYVRNGIGHGEWVKDIPKWNLAWLSFPALDKYLNSEEAFKEILAQVPSEPFGFVLGTCEHNGPGYLHDMYVALTLPPRKFLLATTDFPWELTKAYKSLGESWVRTVRLRAMGLDAADQIEAAATSAIEKAMGNVIHVRFRDKDG